LVKLAKTLGLVDWSLDIQNVKGEAYRDTKGPGKNEFSAMLQTLAEKQTKKSIRDIAILRLLYDLALRTGEVVFPINGSIVKRSVVIIVHIDNALFRVALRRNDYPQHFNFVWVKVLMEVQMKTISVTSQCELGKNLCQQFARALIQVKNRRAIFNGCASRFCWRTAHLIGDSFWP